MKPTTIRRSVYEQRYRLNGALVVPSTLAVAVMCALVAVIATAAVAVVFAGAGAARAVALLWSVLAVGAAGLAVPILGSPRRAARKELGR